ncbi:MAG: hypothetical protein IPG71_06075 [bacterium]|nr:hypothetical protein [bacterium]
MSHAQRPQVAILDLSGDSLPPAAVMASEPFYDGTCVKRFSPYDSSEAVRGISSSPDSIVWYLPVDSLENTFDDLYDSLNSVAVIGFDIRLQPEDNGPIIATVDYWNPSLGVHTCGACSWYYVNSSRDTAAFVWYGKSGPDSLDESMSETNGYWNCPNGMHVGVTLARWADLAQNNSVFGSDQDSQTQLSDGYTTLNSLEAVLDTCRPGIHTPFQFENLFLGDGPSYTNPEGVFIANSYLWCMGGPEPILTFMARRFFTQGLLDTCLREHLSYSIRLDTLRINGPWPAEAPDTIWYTDENSCCGSLVPSFAPVPFFANSQISSPVMLHWGHSFPDSQPLPDGLYRFTLDLVDDAGNRTHDSLHIWISGTSGLSSLCSGDCPVVMGSTNVAGWTHPADELNVRIPIIETIALGQDSVLIIEGNFQSITDDPNPWLIPDSIGEWYPVVQESESTNWARDYFWHLVTDSADLVSGRCHGDFLPYSVRFHLWSSPGLTQTMEFDSCLRLDLRMPVTPPYGLTIQMLGGEVVLSWHPVHLDPCGIDSMNYHVYRRVHPDTNWTSISVIPETSYTDAIAPALGPTFYQVTASPLPFP